MWGLSSHKCTAQLCGDYLHTSALQVHCIVMWGLSSHKCTTQLCGDYLHTSALHSYVGTIFTQVHYVWTIFTQDKLLTQQCQAVLKCCCALHSYVGTTFTQDKLLTEQCQAVIKCCCALHSYVGTIFTQVHCIVMWGPSSHKTSFLYSSVLPPKIGDKPSKGGM